MRLPTVVLLGAQRFEPTLGASVAALGFEGKIATVTAGWQERESEDAELVSHLAGQVVRLELHARCEQTFRDDPGLAGGHHARQDTLRAMQDFYRIRLERALDAERAVSEALGPEAVREEARLACIETVRALDAWHLAQCAAVRADFNARYRPFDRLAVRRQRAVIERLLAQCTGIAIAGGHVAVLINRLLMFGLGELIEDRTVFAWSAGAMAICDRIVLFHERPAHGDGTCEVLDHGLGLLPSVVALPAPETRLRMEDAPGIALKVRRFAPATCIALPARSSVTWRGGVLESLEGALVLGQAPTPNSVGAARSDA